MRQTKYFAPLILIAAILALGILLLKNFDLTRFRPEVESYLAQTLKTEVHFKSMSLALGWRLGLKTEHLEIREPKHATAADSFLTAPRAIVFIDWRSFFKGHFIFSSLELDHPEIHIVRNSKGVWNWTSFGQWLVSSAEIKQGVLYYRDETAEPVFEMQWKELSMRIRQANASSPVEIAGEAAILGAAHRNLTFNAGYDIHQDTVSVQAKYEKRVMELEAVILSLTSDTGLRGRLDIHQLDLESVLPAKWKDREHLSGILTAHLQGEGRGTHPETLKRTLGVEGAVDIRNGAFKRVNFVKDILAQMTSLPDLEKLLAGSSGVPPSFEPLVKGVDARFNILQTNLQIGQGRLYAEKLLLQHPDYLLEADGSIHLVERDADFRAKLVLLPALSRFLVERAKEIAVLRNAEGRIVVPFVYRGILPGAFIYPDLSLLSGASRPQLKTEKALEEKKNL